MYHSTVSVSCGSVVRISPNSRNSSVMTHREHSHRRDAARHGLDLRVGVIAHLHFADRQIGIGHPRQNFIVGLITQPVEFDIMTAIPQHRFRPFDLRRAFDAGLVADMNDRERPL